jgi:acetyltransferase-like isoleucine patch superfamily enzyme
LIEAGHEIAPLTNFPSLPLGGAGKLRIGEESAILGSVTIALHADVHIGSRVVINDGAKLLTGSHHVADHRWRTFDKPIVIKDYAWIAENAIILPGVTIGRGAVVGAGSVVRTDVPDYAICFGNPARVYPTRRPATLHYSPVRQVARFEAWLGSEIAQVQGAAVDSKSALIQAPLASAS